MKISEGNKHTGFEILFEELYPSMLKTALFYVRDKAAAEDVVQEIFLKLWERTKERSGIENMEAYLRCSVKNSCLNYLEHMEVSDRYEREYLQYMREIEGEPEDYLNFVLRLLDKLPPKRRHILELRISEGKSYADISRELGVSTNTVKDHIKKAYAFLRGEASKKNSGFFHMFLFVERLFLSGFFI